MSDKARELLERALNELDAFYEEGGSYLGDEIRAYLAEPEKQEPLSLFDIASEYRLADESEFDWLVRGIRFAEKHHGIGGEDD